MRAWFWEALVLCCKEVGDSGARSSHLCHRWSPSTPPPAAMSSFFSVCHLPQVLLDQASPAEVSSAPLPKPSVFIAHQVFHRSHLW